MAKKSIKRTPVAGSGQGSGGRSPEQTPAEKVGMEIDATLQRKTESVTGSPREADGEALAGERGLDASLGNEKEGREPNGEETTAGEVKYADAPNEVKVPDVEDGIREADATGGVDSGVEPNGANEVERPVDRLMRELRRMTIIDIENERLEKLAGASENHFETAMNGTATRNNYGVTVMDISHFDEEMVKAIDDVYLSEDEYLIPPSQRHHQEVVEDPESYSGGAATFLKRHGKSPFVLFVCQQFRTRDPHDFEKW
eukprot:GHVN01076699.1.p1 GENE.GHVN01076699.1~~GHVN01076699.1.p1  ORF type:complete len:257 (-),score=47.89 GHVN01076699.1:480-1250(-)